MRINDGRLAKNQNTKNGKIKEKKEKIELKKHIKMEIKIESRKQNLKKGYNVKQKLT
jgi:hypothetical protein